MTDAILIADANHSTRMEQGSTWLRSAAFHARHGSTSPMHPPTNLIWRDNQSGNQWGAIEGSKTCREQSRRADEHRARRLAADKLRIEPREPCPKCAVRGDIGCEHRRAR